MKENKEKTKKKNKWVIWIILGLGLFYALLFGLFFISMFSDLETPNISYENDAILVDDDQLMLQNNFVANVIDDTYVIMGYATNISDYDMDYVSITFNIMDSSGNLLGTANAYTDNLKSGKTWKFKAVYYDFDYNEAYDFELISVDYY